MKISKLFHWLYAFLMLMPVFFIGGRVLYTVFNKNAKDSYSGVSYQKSYLNAENVPLEDIYFTFSNEIQYGTSQSKVLTFDNVEYISGNLNANEYQSLEGSLYITLWYDSGYTNNYCRWSTLGTNMPASNKQFTIKGTLVGTNTFVTTENLLESLVYRENNIGSTLDNAFSYSVNQLNENALFSWAKDSFLVTPFAYITGLFGLEATSPINTLLSYWLSISIIWLVFDLVMYLPLLFHRWLDKGVLE